MIFNTWAYYLFFLIPSAVLFRLSPPRFRPWVIVLGGSLFFLFFSYTTLGGLIPAACLGIFLWESITSRFYRPKSWFCWIGVTQAIILLFIFKYWNFFVGLVWFRSEQKPYWTHAFLPLGISFFTFEFIHYAVDRKQNKTESGTLGEYLAFILFFPTMVAGPIKRYQQFLPKLRAELVDWSDDWHRGITRILTGLAKKFAIADLLTAYTNHLNVADIAVVHRAILPLWLLAYGMKIYTDFSAYSDIAIGSARLFGIPIPENFAWPYLQTNIAQFWRHWHISLTSWLMDYIYIPLGGSRVSPSRVYLNVIATMLISGIWHGAGVNFVLWGLWHGVSLAIHRAYRHLRPLPENPTPLSQFASWLLTFVVANLGWAFFCMDVHTALFFFRRLFLG
jgi:alginate O-acetyltransferase complex protein AlgI